MADDHNSAQSTPQTGMQVYGSDAQRLGEIEAIENDMLVLGRGFMRDDFYIPLTMVDRIDRGRVVLRIAGSEVEAGDWTEPAMGAGMTVSGQPADARPETLNEVSTTAKPGMDSVADVDTDEFDHRRDMDGPRESPDHDDRPDADTAERKQYRPPTT